MRKQVEGDQPALRRKARTARKAGKAPSARAATTGSSKQRRHEPRGGDFLTKLASPRRGKQRSSARPTADPNPGSGRRTGQDTPRKPAPRSARPAAKRSRSG